MNTALLIVSSLGLVTSTGSLAIVAKLAHELKQAKNEVDDFKGKTNRNMARIKTVLNEMEF